MRLRGLHEGVGIALDALRQSKVRTGLTILGVAIGVLVVVAMAAVIEGINSSFEEAIESAGPNTYYVVKSYGVEMSTGLEEEDPTWRRRPALRAWYAREIEIASTVENAYTSADLSWFTMTLKAGSNETRAS
ncbi:MAG TPA: ABC transporter permease, partial [Gemmatimonadota bacterium]|nr:ABC transporter permease [Gemmatimonadota bacterium]